MAYMTIFRRIRNRAANRSAPGMIVKVGIPAVTMLIPDQVPETMRDGLISLPIEQLTT